MSDVPPKEGTRVGQIRKTKHLMVLRGLFPSFLTKKTAKLNLVNMVVFFRYFGALRLAPGVRDG